MKKNTVSATMLTMFLINMLPLASNFQQVELTGTTYIRADGSVDPPTAPIQRNGDLYTLTGNINDSIAIERNNITLDGAGCSVQGTGVGRGITLYYRSNVTVKNAIIIGFEMGVYLSYSYGNTLSSNNITANEKDGIYQGFSSNNTINANNIAKSWRGVYFWSSSNNTINANDISNNNYGVYQGFSSNNTIYANNIANNNYSVLLWSSSNNNIIHANNITANNYYGVYLGYSSNNKIYHNNFIDNTNQVYVSSGYANIWDDGYPSGGNYWSDYKDVDLYSGSYQNVTGSDGVWDHPRIIDADNQDTYPLVKSWTPIPGDVNCDGRVNASDLFDLSKAYGCVPGDDKWDERCDFNGDSKVDGSDLFDLSKNYGKVY